MSRMRRSTGTRNMQKPSVECLTPDTGGGGQASCCIGKGADVKDFGTFCAKAIAGIGQLPDTVADRSIPIRLHRKAAKESVERFRRRGIEPAAEELKGRLRICFPDELIGALRDARPDLPDELSDRQQDGAEPLLAIADAAGKDWPKRARSALLEILGCTSARDESIGVRLLADIQEIFGTADKLRTEDLINGLVLIETSPWAEWSHGKPITAHGLARILRRYDITPHHVRDGEKTWRGYIRESFDEAWERYLGRKTAETAQTVPTHAETQVLVSAQATAVPDPESVRNSINTPSVPFVPVTQACTSRSERIRGRL